MPTDLTDLHVDPLDALAARIRERQATAAVVGLGYVGLPLLVGSTQRGSPSIGIDTDRAQDRRADRPAFARRRRRRLRDRGDGPRHVQRQPGAAGRCRRHRAVPAHAADRRRARPHDGADRRRRRRPLPQAGRAGRAGVHDLSRAPPRSCCGRSWRRSGPGGRSGLRARLLAPSASTRATASTGSDTTPKIVAGLTDRCRELAVSFYSRVRAHGGHDHLARARPRWPS